MAELNIREYLQDVADEERLAASWHSIQRRHRRRGRAFRTSLAVAAIVLLSMSALIIYATNWRPSQVALTQITDGSALPLTSLSTGRMSQQVWLSDGSALHLNRITELVIIENSGAVFKTRLKQGRVRFDVKPGGPRTWVVYAGQTRIKVVGTSFTVSQSKLQTRIKVHRGRVLVSGKGIDHGVRELTKDDFLTLERPGTQISTQPPVSATNKSWGRASRNMNSQDEVATANQPSPVLRSSDGARHRKASSLPMVRDDSNANIKETPVQLLLSQADEARQAGQAQLALQYLNQIVSDYPHDAASGLAAFTIGRIRLHDLKQYTAAADGFSLAVKLGLPAGLREQAYAKRVEALSHTSDSRRLKNAADSYNRRYPDGIWKEWVERWSKNQ